MNRWIGVAVWLGVAGALLGCSMDDGDRCTNGFVYDPNLKACGASDAALAQSDAPEPSRGLPSDAAIAPEDAIAVTEAGGAGSEAAAVVPESPVATATFGTACAAAAECTAPTASYCFKMPGSTAGYCSRLNCATDCPTDYKCCNCPAFSVVACMKSSDALKAAAVGCTCS